MNRAAQFCVFWLLLPLPSSLSAATAFDGLPLVPERKFELETEEGTWISVDVSADGANLVFDLLGDLYSLPASGGEATRITSGLAFDSQPVFSPDGEWIAFVSDGNGSDNLWIARKDGSEPRRLSDDRDRVFLSPRWEPDGRRVLVSRGLGGRSPNEIWSYPIDDGAPKQLLASGQRRENYIGAQLSPDGRYLYVAQRQGAFSWDPRPPIFWIVRRDLVKGENEIIVNRSGSAFSPRLSPDGRYLVYGTRFDAQTGLRIRDLEKGEERWLKYPIERDDQEALASRDVIPGYAFTPDGAAIVLSYGGKIWRVEVKTGAEVPVPFKARISLDLGPLLHRRLKVDQGPVRAHLIQGAQLSPDGRRIVFSALGHLYGMDDWTATPRRLTDSSTFEFQPTWSPDGSEIAYVTWSPEGGNLFKLKMDGRSAPESLSAIAGFFAEPAFSPDGEKIAARHSSTQARQQAGDGLARPLGEDLVWISHDGGEPQSITGSGGSRYPHFTDDRQRLFITTGQGLMSVALDGTAEKVHLKVLGKGMAGGAARSPADNLRISPDGQKVLALVNQQLYLIPMPAGEAPAVAPDVADKVPTLDVADLPPGSRRLSLLGADDFSWGEGGKTILWSLGSTLYRQAVASPEAPPESLEIPIEIPRDRPAGKLVLRGARVITMRGEEILENGDIVIDGNRIQAIGKHGQVPLPPAAPVIDLKGKTVVPGFIDVHAHWHELMVGPTDRQAWPLWASLAFGLTSSRDPQSRTLDLFLYKDLVDAGEILGPRLFTTGPGIFSNTPLATYEDALAMTRRYHDHYRTHLLKAYTTGDRGIRHWLVAASKATGMMPTTEGAMDLKLELTHAIDGFSGNEHNIPVFPLYRDVVQLFAQSGIFYTPTLVLSYGGPLGENYFFEMSDVMKDPKLLRFVPHETLESRALRRSWYHPREQVFPKMAKAAAEIAAAGGKVCIGGHGQMQGIQAHWEMWALASGGMPAHEVLRAATLHGAEAMGYQDDLGSLEVGKLADLVVLDRDPLQDIQNTTSLRYVMKNGRLYDAATLEQLWPDRREPDSPWWWKDLPANAPRPAPPEPLRPGGFGAPFHRLIDDATRLH